MASHKNNKKALDFMHCKNPYIHGYFVANFQYFNRTGSVYVFIRKSTEKNEAMADIAM